MLKYFYFSLIFAIFPIIRTQIYPMNPICCQQFQINQNYGCQWPFYSLPGIIKYVDGMEMRIIVPNRNEMRQQCHCLTCQLSKGKSKQLRILFDLEYQHELAANFSKFIDEFIETCPPPPPPYLYSNDLDLDLFTSLRKIQYKYYLDYNNLQWTGWKVIWVDKFWGEKSGSIIKNIWPFHSLLPFVFQQLWQLHWPSLFAANLEGLHNWKMWIKLDEFFHIFIFIISFIFDAFKIK